MVWSCWPTSRALNYAHSLKVTVTYVHSTLLPTPLNNVTHDKVGVHGCVKYGGRNDPITLNKAVTSLGYRTFRFIDPLQVFTKLSSAHLLKKLRRRLTSITLGGNTWITNHWYYYPKPACHSETVLSKLGGGGGGVTPPYWLGTSDRLPF